MRKNIAFAAAAAMLCSVTAAALPANAFEYATYEEYLKQRDDIAAFPDPDERYSELTEDNFVYRIYNGFALVSDYKDTTATEITIPAYVKSTGADIPVIGIVDTPFGMCHELTKITIPDTMDHFSWYDLSVTTQVKAGSNEDPIPKLAEIAVSDTNPNYAVVAGMLYTKDLKTLIGCPPALGIKELVLPEQTETISDYAFLACYDLESAVIPATVKHINNSAFAGCIGLKTAELPATISFVSCDTFLLCKSLTDVKFNGVITEIGVGAFNQCESLAEFTIPDTVTAIGTMAFDDAPCAEKIDGIYYLDNWVVRSDEDIENAVVREGTVGIAEMAFMVRSKCTHVDIPASVKHIGYVCYTGLSSGAAATVDFRAAKLPEKAFGAAKNATDFYIYDPECDIEDSAKTIPAEFKYQNPKDPGGLIWTSDYAYSAKWNSPVTIADGEKLIVADDRITGEVTIHGYEDSTAQAYAEKYGRKFELITDVPQLKAGDLNGDGEVSVADAVCLQKWLLGEPDSELKNWKAADLCKDDVIDVYDMVMLRKLLTNK